MVVLTILVAVTLVVVAIGQGGDSPESRAPGVPSQEPSPEPAPTSTSTPTPTPTQLETTARPGIPAGITSSRQPTTVRLPSGTEVEVRRAVTDGSGELVVPEDVGLAGWWDGGAQVGDPFGTMVIAAHVDSRVQGLGPFSELLSASPGDAIRARATEAEQTYVISSLTRIPADGLPAREDLFSNGGPHRLVLITCAGDFVPEDGGYQELAVVVAEPPPDLR